MLSIIFVNYRSAPLILDSLLSIERYENIDKFDIIIVNNHSDDSGEQMIRQRFPNVKWLQMGYNAGFARANNAGIRQAKGDAILLLNPDTILLDDSITRCYQYLMNSSFIAAGVQLLDRDCQPQISGSHFVKGGLNHLLPIPYWGDFIRWIGYRVGAKAPGIEAPSLQQEVDWISGAFLMVKEDVLEETGLLDEDFFLYAEEVEWCSRLRKKGMLCLFGDLKVIHLEGATINKSQNIQEKGYGNLYDRKGLQLIVSNHLRVRKQYGSGAFMFLLLNYTWGVIVFFAASFFDGLLHLTNPFRQWEKAMAYGKNVVRLWSLLPTIIRNNPYFYKMF